MSRAANYTYSKVCVQCADQATSYIDEDKSLLPMRILLLNPFHGGSHAAWARTYAAHSSHDIDLVTLPDRHWKWRMHGAAVQLAQQIAPVREAGYDLLLTTDMLDLATLLGLRPDLGALPTVVYFHENQLTYPWSDDDPDAQRGLDRRYAWINYTTALAATQVWFASDYHRAVWQEALPSFLHAFPQGRKLPTPQLSKSRVLPLALDLDRLCSTTRPARDGGAPIVVYNHRWEYDKGPDDFFDVLMQLADEGCAFRLVVLGESFARTPPVFAKAQQYLAGRILHWGYAPSRKEYEDWLLRADIALVTAHHDFFGIAVVEAIAAGVQPVLPKGLKQETREAPYREHLSAQEWAAAQYSNRAACLQKMRSLLTAQGVSGSGVEARRVARRQLVRQRYGVLGVVKRYDSALAQTRAAHSSRLNS